MTNFLMNRLRIDYINNRRCDSLIFTVNHLNEYRVQKIKIHSELKQKSGLIIKIMVALFVASDRYQLLREASVRRINSTKK